MLKAVAISAPDWIAGPAKGEHTINSSDPASLFNACRVAAQLASYGIGAWGDSNWTGTRENRRSKTMLMYGLENDLPEFIKLLEKERPNLLLIGAMTLCFPGAIACAKAAREVLGDDVFIVLGGRHPTETIYRCHDNKEIIKHHAGSPAKLIMDGAIDNVFDLIVSGDAEYVIVTIGEIIGKLQNMSSHKNNFYNYMDAFDNTMGEWLLAWVKDNNINIKKSNNIPIDYNRVPSPSSMFGITTSFDIYPGRKTAHAFSDTGRGCAYNCDFCSERRAVTGNLRQMDSSAKRLYRQLESAVRVIQEDTPQYGASAFVEDSILLAGNPRSLTDFGIMLEEKPLDILFGAQLTIDQILNKQKLIQNISKNGLDYFFIGLETLSPEEIGGMSKDTKGKKDSWVNRAKRTFEFLTTNDIRCGAAILFGLGESHESRLKLLEFVDKCRDEFNMPVPVSMNWGVQHPLTGFDANMNYNYVEWGTPKGPHLDVFYNFGEASLLYPLHGVAPPVLEEISEVRDILVELNTTTKRELSQKEKTKREATC